MKAYGRIGRRWEWCRCGCAGSDLCRSRVRRAVAVEIEDQLASALHPAEIRLIECDAGACRTCPRSSTGRGAAS